MPGSCRIPAALAVAVLHLGTASFSCVHASTNPGSANGAPVALALRPGDDCSNPILVHSLPYSTLDSTSGALDDFPPGPCFPGQPHAGAGPDLVYRFQLMSAQPESVAFYVSPQEDWDVALSVMSPNCGPALPCQAAANNAGPGQPETVILFVQPFQSYYLVVDGVNGDMGPFLFMCVRLLDTCGGLAAPALMNTLSFKTETSLPNASGDFINLLTRPRPPCRVLYVDDDIHPNHSWARSKRFDGKFLGAEAEHFVRWSGSYTVTPKYSFTTAVPCKCFLVSSGRIMLNSWTPAGSVKGVFIQKNTVQPFFPVRQQVGLTYCNTAEGGENCSKDTSATLLVNEDANVPVGVAHEVKLEFSTRVLVSGGDASGYCEIGTYALIIECADPPESAGSHENASLLAESTGDLARGPRVAVDFDEWKMETGSRRVVRESAASVPSGFGWAFIPVEGSDIPGGLAGSAGFGFGSALYLTRDTGSRAPPGAPGDTSQILMYGGGPLNAFGGPIMAPSALEFDRFGIFGGRLFAAAADSFDATSGTPIRGRGVLDAIDAAGVITPFTVNLDSPVALAFAPGPPWNGNLYVAEKESGTIDQVSPGGIVTGFTAGLGSPMDLVFADGSFGGLLYAVDADSVGPDTLAHANAGRIVRYSAAGTPSSFASEIQYPTSIVRADPGGPFGDYLYVSTYNEFDGEGLAVPLTGRVLRIDPLGEITVFADSLELPMDMAFGPSGDLFVAVSGGLVKISSGSSTGVRPASISTRFLEAFPNPFVTAIEIRFRLAAAVTVLDLSVFDLLGRRVATLEHGAFEPGEYRATWNSADRSGEVAPAGMYWIRLRTGSDAAIGRAILRIE